MYNDGEYIIRCKKCHYNFGYININVKDIREMNINGLQTLNLR